jgi:Ribbon-helix-helix protein, copG family
MRTTIEIDDQVLERVKRMAKYEKRSTGRVVSDLLRQQLDQPPEIIIKNGIPVLCGSRPPKVITSDDVDAMMDELLREEAGL